MNIVPIRKEVPIITKADIMTNKLKHDLKSGVSQYIEAIQARDEEKASIYSRINSRIMDRMLIIYNEQKEFEESNRIQIKINFLNSISSKLKTRDLNNIIGLIEREL